jgi:predicted DNA-binding transcriptional regulator AlpA
MIRFADFPTLGINYSRQGIKNMIAKNRFPAAVRLMNGRLVWDAVAINTWLTSRGVA